MHTAYIQPPGAPPVKVCYIVTYKSCHILGALHTYRIFEQINKGFRALSQLIDGTPLHTMGKILNDMQESAANAAGYGEGEEGSDGGAKEGESSGEVGRGRKKGREGAKRKKGGVGDHDDDDQDKGRKIRKWKLNPKK